MPYLALEAHLKAMPKRAQIAEIYFSLSKESQRLFRAAMYRMIDPPPTDYEKRVTREFIEERRREGWLADQMTCFDCNSYANCKALYNVVAETTRCRFGGELICLPIDGR